MQKKRRLCHMSARNNDRQGRFRSKTIGYRISPEEYEVLQRKIKLSGMTKQDYMIHCMENQSIIIYGSPYVYRSLKIELNHFIELFQNMQQLGELPLDELEILEHLLNIVIHMRNKKEALIKVEMEPRQ